MFESRVENYELLTNIYYTGDRLSAFILRFVSFFFSEFLCEGTKNCGIEIAKFSSWLLFSGSRKVPKAIRTTTGTPTEVEAREGGVSIGNKNIRDIGNRTILMGMFLIVLIDVHIPFSLSFSFSSN